MRLIIQLCAILAVVESVSGGSAGRTLKLKSDDVTDNMRHVIQMTPKTMMQTIGTAEHDLLLVYYYADWCAQCRIFSEKFAGAAAILARAGYKNILARVLAEDQGVDQDVDEIPALKLFNLKNDTLWIYEGAMEVQPVVDYVARFLEADNTLWASWGLLVDEKTATAMGWTRWINSVPPGFSGDVEMLESVRNKDHIYWRGPKNKYFDICDGEEPINQQCRTTSGVSWNETGQILEVPCVIGKGLSCRHCENNHKCSIDACHECTTGCLDYEVRYKCCVEHCDTQEECPEATPICSQGCCKSYTDTMAEPLVEADVIERGVTTDGVPVRSKPGHCANQAIVVSFGCALRSQKASATHIR
jgi:hypothetical protein